MIWAPRTPCGRSGPGRAPAGAERRPKSRPRRKNRPRHGRLRVRAAADSFAAADFFTGAPRRPARGRAPAFRSESLEPKSSQFWDDITLVLG